MTWSYAVACVVLPSLWAVAVFHVLGWLERHRALSPSPHSGGPRRARRGAAAPGDDDVPPADYMI